MAQFADFIEDTRMLREGRGQDTAPRAALVAATAALVEADPRPSSLRLVVPAFPPSLFAPPLPYVDPGDRR